jgi:hypothetical protein
MLTSRPFAAWETGNELGAYFLSGGAPPGAWTNNIASYIKSIAPRQLVADGSDGLIDMSGVVRNNGMHVDPVDMVYVFSPLGLEAILMLPGLAALITSTPPRTGFSPRILASCRDSPRTTSLESSTGQVRREETRYRLSTPSSSRCQDLGR